MIPWHSTVSLKASDFPCKTYVVAVVSLTGQMDELKKLVCSRHGHKSHLSKILSNVEQILQKLSAKRSEHPDTTLEHSDAILLAEHRKQLQHKADVFTELDEKIIQNTNDE